MQIRDALISQAPSLQLQRAAADEIARLDAKIRVLTDALWKACGDDAKVVDAYIKSQDTGSPPLTLTC